MLRELREKRNVTQAELGKHLGFTSSQYISNIERGLTRLPVKHFRKTAKLLDVSVEVFIDQELEFLRAKVRKAFKV